MIQAIRPQKVVMLQSPSMQLHIDEKYHNDFTNGFDEEHTAEVDCPDCFDTMIKVYDSDEIRYRCENCDLIIGARCL